MGASISRGDISSGPHTAPSSPRSLASMPVSANTDKRVRRVGHIRATISFYSGVRQLQEIVTTTTNIGPNGGFFYGSANPPAALIEDLAEVFRTPPADTPLRDSKAHQLLVTYCDGWHAIPSPVNFSRHAGTCLLLGDRTNPTISYTVKLGDCFRLGSVGLVVVAMRLAGRKEQLIHPAQLSCIQEENLFLHADDEEAFRFVDEKQRNKSCNQSVRTLASVEDDGDDNSASEEAPLCYMCYDAHDDESDPLVAPCDCKGDTRYLHVSCLQRWYANLGCGPNAIVVRTTANGAPACKICGSAYKTKFRDSSGNRANIVEANHSGPYISFMVVTRHENAPQLFNTKFRLNFRDPLEPSPPDAEVQYPTDMMIGRSSACNMVLDYRTVSTMHAKISYQVNDALEAGTRGAFILEDLHSSNGSLLYLQRPLLLGSVGSRTILRMGRTTMCLDVRSGAAGGGGQSRLGIPSCIACRSVDETFEPCAATPEELHTIMSLSCVTIVSPPKKVVLSTTLTDSHPIAVFDSEIQDIQSDVEPDPVPGTAGSDNADVPEHSASGGDADALGDPVVEVPEAVPNAPVNMDLTMGSTRCIDCPSTENEGKCSVIDDDVANEPDEARASASAVVSGVIFRAMSSVLTVHSVNLGKNEKEESSERL